MPVEGIVNSNYNTYQRTPFSSNPWYSVKTGFDQVRNQVEQYDQLATPKPDLTDAWMDSASFWGGRVAIGAWGDRLYQKYTSANNHIIDKKAGFNGQSVSKMPSVDALKAKWGDMGKDAISYRELLGIRDKPIQFGPDKALSHWTELFSRKGGQVWRNNVKDNFRTLFKPDLAEKPTLKSYLQKTLIDGNVKSITKHINNGHLVSAGASLLPVGIMFANILFKTRDAYQAAKAKEDGSVWSRLKTWGKTATAFVAQTVKSVISWEVGNIGVAVGATLVGITGVPALIGSILVGSLFSVCTNKALAALLPDPSDECSQTMQA